MQAIMLGLASVPGVVGGLLSDERGNVLAQSFPPFFDQGVISGVAEMLQDGAIGLHEVTGGAKYFDLRFELGRVIIKALPNMFIAVLCKSTVNVQLLFIGLNIAIKKLEKISINHLLVQAAQQAVPQVQVGVLTCLLYTSPSPRD